MDSILDWNTKEGKIFRGGSGSGINLSNIRGSMEPLSKGGTASGPVSFMRGADSWAGTIKSGGKTRRAAKMVVLDVDHPDIREFIWCKAKEEDKAAALRDAGFDMSIDGDGFNVDPVPERQQLGPRHRRVHARRRERPRVAHDRARDGRAGRRADARARADARDRRGRVALRRSGRPVRHDDQPVAHVAELGAHQRVEPVLGVHARRRLGLQPRVAEPHEVPPRRRHASTSPAFEHAVDIVLLAQEIVVGPSSYPTEEIGVNARAFRQLGLGYANLGAFLMANGMPYDSDAGRGTAAAITALMTGRAYAQSAKIAAAIGPYEHYEHQPRAAQRRSCGCTATPRTRSRTRRVADTRAARRRAALVGGRRRARRGATATATRRRRCSRRRGRSRS